MKRFAAIASMLILAAAPAFAAGSKTETVIIPQNVVVNASPLPAGTYRLEYTGTGPTVQVTISTQEKKTVVTFAAKAIEQKGRPGVNAINIGGINLLRTINLDNVSLQVLSAAHAGE
jgi:hypothetical protein